MSPGNLVDLITKVICLSIRPEIKNDSHAW